MSEQAASTPSASPPPKKAEKLDDVLLAMDVVDTLRHREQLVMRELDSDTREAELIERLREIYKAQGIDVPDRILKDGVKALDENRFVYQPPKSSFSVKLAKLYVTRNQWLKPVMSGLAAFLAAMGLYHFTIAAPNHARKEAARIEMTQTLPAELAALRDKAQSIAETDHARAMAEAYYQDGVAAVRAGKRDTARASASNLTTLLTDLEAAYTVRIVSRPGEYSGLFRIPDGAPDARNYYLIVEAIDAAGRTMTVPVFSEETQAPKRVTIWGVRVPKSVFDAVAADKQDDQIIQRAIIGEKPPGALSPTFTVDTRGGAIFDW